MIGYMIPAASPYNNRMGADTAATQRIGGNVIRPPIGVLTPGQSQVARANAQIVSAWLDWLRVARNRSDATVRNYRSACNSWVQHLGGVPLAAADVPTAEAWVVRPRSNGAIGKPASRARDVAVLRSLYGWMLGRGMCSVNLGAMVAAPTVHNVNPKPITDAQWLAAWDAADDRLRLAMGLMFWFGLRRSEVAALRGAHVDVTNRQLVGFPRKGGGDDVLPWGEIADVWSAFMPDMWSNGHIVELMTAQIATIAPQEPLCGPWGPDALGRGVSALAGRLGASWTAHSLRHSFVTNLLRVRCPIEHVSRLANHSSLTITMRYAKLGGGELKSWREAEEARRMGQTAHVTQGDHSLPSGERREPVGGGGL
jgi:site-specific recombinase XerD